MLVCVLEYEVEVWARYSSKGSFLQSEGSEVAAFPLAVFDGWVVLV